MGPALPGRHSAAKEIMAVAAVVLAAAVLLWVYSGFDPAAEKWFPKCMFLNLTGLKCPGCGAQRAFHAALSGQFREAVGYNAALLPGIPLVVLLVLAELPSDPMPRLRAFLTSRAAIIVLIAAIVGWTVVRNVAGW